jgi:hypothetical protein
MKSIQSFDAFLLTILLVISLSFLTAELNMGLVVYFGVAAASVLLFRKVMGVQTLGEAIYWLRARAWLAFYLGFIWVVNVVYIVYAFSQGYVGLIEAIGLYPFVCVVFSALVLLGYLALQQVLKLFGPTK